MKSEITSQLLALNSAFYTEHAGSFSATRQRIQPGIARALTEFIASRGGFADSDCLHLLDLGCGNGNLAHWLADQKYHGWYTGVDQSDELLQQAESGGERFAFLKADLAQSDWLAELPTQPFDLVTAFAVLHHLPGEGLRIRLLREIKRLLAPDGEFIHSVWQFNSSPRLVKRIQPWGMIGLNSADVDEGDALLDWRAEMGDTQTALRYVHAFSESELQRLADKSGFKITAGWLSDGKEGCLGLYQAWSRS
ncbi:MAG: class I SAM-dependent methyltransferase [Anaerolineaceae bacterium]